jgi:dihydroxyacetone kinase-like protein
MEAIKRSDLPALFQAWQAVMADNKDALITLDGVMGDGDLGLTMLAAFTAAAAEVATAAGSEVATATGADLGQVLMKAGMAMAKAAPSTMGTLVGTGFMRAGKALKDKPAMAVPELALFFQAFVTGLMDRGKAKPGDKTIIDALHPVALALETAAAQGLTLAAAAPVMAKAAADGLESTKTMVAQHGRAAYYQEKSRDKQDPGATVGCLLVTTLADFILGA